MSYLTINDQPVLRACITFPRIGVWHAEIEMDSDEALSGSVELFFADGELTFKGTVFRAGSFLGRSTALILGGAGEMRKELAPKFYEGVPLRLPLQDALSEAGEALSSVSTQEVLDFLLPKWTRIRRSAGGEVLQLAAAVGGVSWRVLFNGDVWIGTESWSAFQVEHTILEEDLSRKLAVIDLEFPVLYPGASLDGKNVGRVVYEVSPQSLSTKAYYE